MQRNTKGLPYTFYNCQVNSLGKLNDTRIKITYRLFTCVPTCTYYVHYITT